MAHLKKEKGDIGVAKIISDLTSKQWNVCIPISEHTKYDLIAEKEGKIVRVQVRFTTQKNGKLNIRLSSVWSDKKGNHVVNRKSGDYDVLAVYCPNTDSAYYISDNLFDNKKTITLSLTGSKNNQKKKVRLASDFLQI